MKSNYFGVALLLAGLSSALSAQTSTSFQEQSKLIKAPNAITAIGNDLFGDTVNLYNGTLQFSQVDVMLPGNNSLQVGIGRTVATGQYLFDDRPFGRWDLDIPRMHGMFAKGTSSLVGWKAKDGSNSRCSTFGAPPLADGLNYRSEWAAREFWQGNFMYIPGQGEQQMLSRSAAFTDAPSTFTIDGIQVSAFPVVTNGKWAIGCLPSLANDTSASKTMGQGFVAVSPDGTKYKFDWMVTYQANVLTKPFEVSEPAISDPPLPESITAAMAVEAPLEPPGTDAVTTPTLPMTEVWILPTKVIDRFGNTVTYTYNPARPANLKSIVASDGRSITLTYHLDANGAETARIKTVSDGIRTWTYSYQTGVFTDLSQVQLPDGSKWQLAGITPLFAAVQYQQLGDIYCSAKPMPFQTVLTGSMTHPSGATGTFTLVPTEHGRSDVPYFCMNYRYVYPVYYFTQSLTEKSITGPGISQLKWTYAYGPSNASTAPCNGCVTTKSVLVTDPEGHANRYVYGNQFYVSEGRLEQLDEGWNGSSALRTTQYAYRARAATDEYPVEDGTSDEVLGDGGTNLRNRPEERRTILQQDVAFVRVSENFDKFLRPTKVTKTDSNGSIKQEHITFEHNPARWVLGNVKQVVSAGVIPVANTYDQTTLLPKTVTEFGKLKQSFTYHADGNIYMVTDGKGQVTSYTNYKRGIPQNVRFHNDQTTSLVVNNIGKITSLTDEAAATTTFGYDAMGRLASVNHPTGDTVTWAPTTISTWQSTGGQFDLAAGHWRQQLSTGTARTVTYYDALLRPAYVERWDDSDVTGTLRTLKYQHDSAGRMNYESYPRRTYGQIGPGTFYAYDALGRQTAKAAKSEVGEPDGYAWTRTNYEYGFKTSVTDPRGYVTTYGYQTFDEPSHDAITSIAAPEGVAVTIARDVFGKPTSITRGGAGKSVIRRFVYDSAQRMCKTIEPETGSTVQDYDAADNVAWRATGLVLPSTTSCDSASVAATSKVVYQYDARNRSTGSTFGDSSPAIVFTLTPDGLPGTVSSNGAVWTNTYNKRRLLERESLAYGGATYNIIRSYDANGSLRQLTYPDNTAVAYSPNALGEPRQIGAYANTVAYHPNGGIASFNYGTTTTGIKHSATQNERGLPLRSTDIGGVRDDQYGYDASGNVTSIADLLPSNVNNRSMIYDGLDRLKTATAPNMWGSATYGYDALDNLTSTTITGGISARNTSHNINTTTNRLDSITNGPPGFNVSYDYDSRGNVTQRNSQLFEYDLGNRLKRAVGRATYTYDGFKRRVSVVGTDGVTRVQIYAQDGKLLYIAPSGGTPTKYVYLRNHVLAEVSGSTVTYNHTDALGSPVAQTSASGVILNRTRYEPYGYIVAGAPRTIGFTGHVNDNDTGLVYMQQRYYDAFAGRLLGGDPVVTDGNNGASFNRYAYANNNPYKYVDPDGRQERSAEAFSDQFRRDILEGNAEDYEPFRTPVNIVTGVMIAVPVVAVTNVATVAISGKIAQKAWKTVSTQQKASIRDWFKGKENAKKVSTDTLRKYEKLAERQIKRDKDNNDEQKRRLEQIRRELEKRREELE